MVAELSLPARIRAHNWMDPRSAPVRPLRDFVRFTDLVRDVMRASASSRLYWFPTAGAPLADRKEITEATFPAFCAYADASEEPDVWVWEPTGASRSPGELPVAAAGQQQVPSTPVAGAGAGAASRHTGRSSAVQRQVRAAVLRRDGAVCVLCRCRPATDSLLVAAHVVRHGSSAAVMAEATLLSTNDTCNGVMLCSALCHHWYDQLHWWVDDSGLVAMTEALRLDPVRGPHFAPWAGLPLLRPDPESVEARYWPRPQTWAVQARLCSEQTEKRHALAASKEFECVKCGGRYASSSRFEEHRGKCAATSRRLLFTPAERERMPAAVLDAPASVAEVDADDDDDDSGGDREDS